MTISSELMMAILSMDGYNRGYNAGMLDGVNVVDGIDQDGLGAGHIGSAQILNLANLGIGENEYANWKGAGFYAVAYDWNGQTVISYRGTDSGSELPAWLGLGPLGELLLTDLPLAYQSDYDEPSVHLASQFYQNVRNVDPASNVIFTGHSLGGALAGFMGSLYDRASVAVDPIDFVPALRNLGLLLDAFVAARDNPDRPLTEEEITGTDSLHLYEAYVSGESQLDKLGIPLENVDSLKFTLNENYNAFHVNSSIAQLARFSDTPSTAIFSEQGFGNTNFASYLLTGWESLNLSPIAMILDYTAARTAMHGAVYNVIFKYAEDLIDTNGPEAASWFVIVDSFLSALSNPTIASEANPHISGPEASENYLAHLAYSSLDDGTLIFGNSGIRALFNDLNELGGVIANESHNAQFDANYDLPGWFNLGDNKSLEQLLVDLVVQYSEALAANKVDYGTVMAALGYDPKQGVLGVSADGKLLQVDLSDLLWNVVVDGAVAPVNGETLVLEFFDSADDLVTTLESIVGVDFDDGLLAQLAQIGWGVGSQSIFDRLHYRTEAAPAPVELESRSYSGSPTAPDGLYVDLYVGTDLDDDVQGTGGNDLIAGGDGDDIIKGGLGRDLLLGGDGSDLFIDSVAEVLDDHPASQNGDDIYIGDNPQESLLNGFLDWLSTGADTDTVRYTVDAFIDNDPQTPEDESALQRDGVSVTDLKKTVFGELEALEVSVKDQKTGETGTDILVSIDKIELSERPDHLKLTDEALDAPILIDMGQSDRIAAELEDGETLAPNAFMEKVDVADYSQLSHGINYVNGSTSKHSDIGPLNGVFQFEGYGSELLTLLDYSLSGTLGHNDALRVEGADKIILTDHDDVLIGAEYGSIVETGAGDDKIWLADGVGIADLSMDDRIMLGGAITLYGGLRNSASESPYAWGAFGTAYGLNDQGELIIRNAFWEVARTNADGTTSYEVATTYIMNWKDSAVPRTDGMGETGAGGIFLAEYTMSTILLRDMSQDMIGKASVLGEGAYDILGLMMKAMTGDMSYGGEDPLVLDLDGDGLELTARDRSKARMDIDNDLYAEASGFVGKDDGVLARDLNSDGKITGSAEMFGFGDTSGFSVLATLDANADGKVDAGDNGLADFNGDGEIDGADTFESLLIWQDSNENHTTDLGELQSVAAHGIVSITVPETPAPAEPVAVINGNTVTQTSTYTLADGTVRTLGDIIFRLDNQNTHYTGEAISVSQSVVDLADLKGYGTLVSLHEAMSVEASSEAEVRAATVNLASPDLGILREAIRPILTAWAKGSPVKIDGVTVTGEAGLSTYHSLAILRDDDDIVDYVWGINPTGDAIPLEVSGSDRFTFASGVVLSTNAAGSSVTSGDIAELLSDWTSSAALAQTGGEAISYSTGSVVGTDSQTYNYIEFAKASGEFVRFYNYGSAGWASGLAGPGGNPLSETVTATSITGNDFAFYERLIGESLQPFFEKPDSASGGYSALNVFLDQMEDTLNLFAVRLAVQDGPLSEYFQTVAFDAANDSFRSTSGNQLGSVFAALLEDAEQSADAVSWLQEWKPFFDIFLADYQRESASQTNSYAFLVQNMLNAVERHPGGITVEQYASALGIPAGLVINGSGTVTGTSDLNILIIDGNETRVEGGAGFDNYIVGKAFQSTEIYDLDATLGGDWDTVRFSAHTLDDLEFSRDDIDLLITDKISGETIRVVNQFEGRWPGPTISDASLDYGINELVFANGTVWGKTDIALAVSKIDAASTHIVGTADIDVLEGGKGDDLLEGAGDTDIYRFGRGDGKDTIHDFEDNAFRNDQDMLQFLSGIRIGDLIFQRDGASSDLLIRFKDHPIDQITIQGQFAATYTGFYGIWYMNRIDLFTFDNGTSLTSDQVASLVLKTYSTDGNDQLYGMEREDILRAGKGDDFISGGNQSDLYLYSRGDGNDVIQDGMTNILSGTDDYLRFGEGISWGDLSFGRIDGDYNSVIIYINGGQSGSVTLKNEYVSTADQNKATRRRNSRPRSAHA